MISPVDIYEKVLDITVEKESDLKVQVFSGEELLVEYRPER